MEERPDGSWVSILANFIGQTIRRTLGTNLADAANPFIMFSQERRAYDENHAGLIRHETPSSYQAVTTLYRSPSQRKSPAVKGLVYYFDYHRPRRSVGYLSKVMRGPGGVGADKAITLNSYEFPKQPKKYAEREIHMMQSETTWFVASTAKTQLPAAQPSDPDPTRDRVIAFEYETHPGSCQVASRTTRLPAVAWTQNGLNQATSTTEKFDRYGNLVWSRDLRNVLSYFEYDRSLGVLVKTIRDVDTSFIPWIGKTGRQLVTELVPDRFGRIVQTIGSPVEALTSYPPQFQLRTPANGTQSVRPAAVSVYDELSGQIRSAQGYLKADGSSISLLPSITVSVVDRAGRVTSEKAFALRRLMQPAALERKQTLEGLSPFRWTQRTFGNDNALNSIRDYYDIPNKKYRETVFHRDNRARSIEVTSPTGTIEKTYFDLRGLPVFVESGTAGKLKPVTKLLYDHSEPGNLRSQSPGPKFELGNGNVTTRVDYVDDHVTRISQMQYDWLDRLIKLDRDVWIDGKSLAKSGGRSKQAEYQGDLYGEEVEYGGSQFEHAASRVQLSTDSTPSSRVEAEADIFGRVFRRTTRPTDTYHPNLIEEFWFDEAGAVIKHKPAGSEAFVKYQYDSLGQVMKEFHAISRLDPRWQHWPAYARTVQYDIVLLQREFERDQIGNLIGVKQYQRQPIDVQHDRHSLNSIAGDLSADGRIPGSRVTYSASWYDVLGRQVAAADYGTNVLSRRPSVVPGYDGKPLVSTVEFNNQGERERVRGTDFTVGSRGETFFEFDNLGRLVKQVENINSFVNRRTTRFTYRADDQIETVTLVNRATNDQTTRYEYGTTLGEHDIASGHLRRGVVAPDGARTGIAYNRQGQVKRLTDPNGTVHQYEFDGLGRTRADQIVTFGRLTDQRIQRIGLDYDEHGRLHLITSFAAGAKPVNAVRRTYNDLGVMELETQDHFGDGQHALNVKLGFGRTDNAEPRLEGLTYPSIILDGAEQKKRVGYGRRQIAYLYDGPRKVNQLLGRVQAIKYESAHDISSGEPLHKDRNVAEYTYGGLADITKLACPEPGLSTNLGDYDALDAHGRIASFNWRSTFSVDERIAYAYDRAHHPCLRLNQDILAEGLDEAYQYDSLSRLISFQRGKVRRAESGAVQSAAIPDSQRTDQQSWKLDEAGNWLQFNWQEGEGADASPQAHTRQHDTANEITGIAAAGGSANSARWARPHYDDAGNMTRIPDPRSPQNWLRCIYDAWNRLVEVRDRGGNVVANYQYDGLDRRIVKQTKDSQGNDRWRHFYYSPQGNVLEEREAAKATELPDFPDRQHFWGVDGQLLFSEHGTVDATNGWSALDKRLYVIRDVLGSTTALRDTTSLLRGRFAYQPYGEPRLLTNSFAPVGGKLWHDFDYLFAGYRYDHETGLYHTRARQYHPLLGLWTGRDPAGYMDGLNLYEYVTGSPTNFVDPTGEALIIGALIVGGLLIAGAGIYVGLQAANSDDPSAVLSASARGVGAGAATVGDTFTFGLTPLGEYRDELYDDLGVTGTWADYGSRFAAVAARESLILAATVGTGQILRGMVTGTRFISRQLARAASNATAFQVARYTHAGLTGYELYSSGQQVYQGVSQIREGQVGWGIASIGLGALGLYGGGRGILDELGHLHRRPGTLNFNKVAGDRARDLVARREGVYGLGRGVGWEVNFRAWSGRSGLRRMDVLPDNAHGIEVKVGLQELRNSRLRSELAKDLILLRKYRQTAGRDGYRSLTWEFWRSNRNLGIGPDARLLARLNRWGINVRIHNVGPRF